MKKALYSFAMAIVMVASGAMISSCNSSAKTEEKQAEEVEEVAEECNHQLAEAPFFAGIELTQEQKDQLNALVPPCAKAECDKAECDKTECDKAECEKAECDKAECDKAECNKEEGKCCKEEGKCCKEEAKAKFMEEIKAILTPEQYAQFEANLANCPKCNGEESKCCEKEEGEKAEK